MANPYGFFSSAICPMASVIPTTVNCISECILRNLTDLNLRSSICLSVCMLSPIFQLDVTSITNLQLVGPVDQVSNVGPVANISPSSSIYISVV